MYSGGLRIVAMRARSGCGRGLGVEEWSDGGSGCSFLAVKVFTCGPFGVLL